MGSITLEGVNKTFGPVSVIPHVDLKVKDGVVPTYAENDAMDYFVQGVVGKLAQ